MLTPARATTFVAPSHISATVPRARSEVLRDRVQARTLAVRLGQAISISPAALMQLHKTQTDYLATLHAASFKKELINYVTTLQEGNRRGRWREAKSPTPRLATACTAKNVFMRRS